MVRLNIIVEGGTSLNNVPADTANNVEALRQSLHHFFARILGREDVDIAIFMGWGYRMAAKQFLRQQSSLLYVDSDAPYADRYRWFAKLVNNDYPEKNIIIPEAQKDKVYFMVQEMEAWFLKQPDCLERWADKEGCVRRHRQEILSEHSLIRNKDIEDIVKPSKALKELMKHFFSKNKEVVRYGKLKTAPGLLDAMDADMLITKDAELQRFKIGSPI